MSILQKFGVAVREYRERRHLSQEELAFRANLDRTYISGIERGRRNPSLKTIEKIAGALEINLDTLFKTVVEITESEGIDTL